MAKKMYILVNQDVKIGKGKLPGQVGHAVNAYLYHEYIAPLAAGEKVDMEMMRTYMKQQTKIVLKCPLERLERLEAEGTGYVIRDKGLTHLPPNTLTCVNYGIFEREELPEWIQELKLYN